MNRKHLAAIFVGFVAVLMVQGILTVRKNLVSLEKEVAAETATALGVESRLLAERTTLADLESRSQAMLDFLSGWSTALAGIDSPEAGELRIAQRVKESGLVTLAQRFEVVRHENDSIPQIVRAHLTFEDNYAKSLNWLGGIEEGMPATRVASLKIVRGETGNDIRMNLVIDLPMLRPEPGGGG